MKKIRKIDIFLFGKIGSVFFLTLLLSSNLFAQFEYSFLVYPNSSSARDVALGNATGSDISNYSSSLLNPASLSFSERNTVTYNNRHSWTNNIFTFELGYQNVGKRNSSFAFDIQYLGNGLNEFNYLGDAEIFQPSLKRIQLSLSYSYSFSPVFSVGASGRGFTAWNEYYALEHGNIDFGAIYSPSDLLSYSLVFRGVGYSLGYNRLGNGRTTLVNINMEESIEYGASLNFPEKGERRILTLYASTEAKIKVEEIYYRLASEFIINKVVALRAGYINGVENYREGLEESGFSTGIGFNFAGFSVNYSLMPSGGLNDRVHQMGLVLKL